MESSFSIIHKASYRHQALPTHSASQNPHPQRLYPLHRQDALLSPPLPELFWIMMRMMTMMRMKQSELSGHSAWASRPRSEHPTYLANTAPEIR